MMTTAELGRDILETRKFILDTLSQCPITEALKAAVLSLEAR